MICELSAGIEMRGCRQCLALGTMVPAKALNRADIIQVHIQTNGLTTIKVVKRLLYSLASL